MSKEYSNEEILGNEIFMYQDRKVRAVRRIRRGENTLTLLVKDIMNGRKYTPVPTFERIHVSRSIRRQLIDRSSEGDKTAEMLLKEIIYFINDETEVRGVERPRSVIYVPTKPRLPWQE